MNNATIATFRRQFPDDQSCLKYILQSRYNTTCPLCYQTVHFYKLTGRKAFSCGRCRGHIYPLAGTIFHKSRTSLWLWFYALYVFAVSKHGVSAKELQRTLGVTYKCAWRMAHQIRSLMRYGGTVLSGTVEADEGYYGHKDHQAMLSGVVERGESARVVVRSGLIL